MSAKFFWFTKTATSILIFSSLLLTCSSYASQTITDPVINISNGSAFEGYKLVIRQYLKTIPADKAKNQFCIIGFREAAGDKYAWVILPTIRQAILWEDGNDDLAQSRRIINLDKDVVKNETELGSSTYLVTQAWLTDLRNKCAKSGISDKD